MMTSSKWKLTGGVEGMKNASYNEGVNQLTKIGFMIVAISKN